MSNGACVYDAHFFGSVATWVMIAVTLFGFLFVRKQLRLSAVDHLYGRMHDIHKLFILNEELRKHIFNPTSRPLSEFSPRETAITELIADFFQQVFLGLEYFPDQTRKDWKRYMKDTLKSSPALRTFVKEKVEWYPTNYVDKLLKVTNIQASGPTENAPGTV